MNPYFSTEKLDISISDLAKYLLSKSVKILLGAIAFSLLLAGYQFHRQMKRNNNTTLEEPVYNEKLEQYQIEAEWFSSMDTVFSDSIAAQNEYMKNSIVMNLDPYHVPTSTAVVRVIVPEGTSYEEIRSIVYRLKYRVLYGEYLEVFADNNGLMPAYVKELVGVSTSESGEPAELEDPLTSEEIIMQEISRELPGEFIIYAIGKDQEMSERLLDEILAELKKPTEDDISIMVLEQYYLEAVSNDIMTKQDNAQLLAQNIATRHYNIMPDAEKKLQTSAASVTLQTGNIQSRSLIKYGAAGFLFGGILLCVLYSLLYIRSDRLRDYNDMANRGFRLKDLGGIKDSDVSMIVANIRNYSGESRKLFITGGGEQSQFMQAFDRIQSLLPEYETVCAWDALHDAGAREKLAKCDVAVLLEQREISHYSDMREELSFLYNSEKEVLGIVII